MGVCFSIHYPQALDLSTDTPIQTEFVFKDSEEPPKVPLPCGHLIDDFPGQQARVACPSPSCDKEYTLERRGSAGIHIQEVP